MADSQIVTKRMAISKANAQMVAVVGVASFITIFCLVAAKAVISDNSYQAHVISAQKTAKSQLSANLTAYNQLQSTYAQFIAPSTNVIGGASNGTGSNSGNNAQIVLDALPSTYDFPALTSTIEKILTTENLQIGSITGNDNELTEQNNNTSPNPAPVSMPFSFTVENASYSSIGTLISSLEHSIRPIQVDSIDLTGSSSSMTLTVNAHTYYQPGKTVNITPQVVSK